jgi:succinate-semialdehyde dehydrogenase/glutarate-semialdehyde dehydrogenase
VTVQSAPPRRVVADGLDSAFIAHLAARIGAADDAPRATIRAPFTGEEIAALPQSTPDDVAHAVARGRRAQPAWAGAPPRERAAVLWRFHDRVLEQQARVLDLIQIEAGKARVHAFEEVADGAITASWYARRGPRLLADTRRPGLMPGLSVATEVRHPWGVVGVIAPWNYPLTLAVAETLPALLAGNAVVLKPDTQTALTALWVAQTLEDAGLPPDVLQVVVGDGPVVGAALIDTVDYVCFTGSTATGRTVAQQAAARLVGSSLELGGKNSLYVAADADLARAAEAAVRDCFSGAGQVCVTTERLVLHRDVADAFLERFVRRVEDLRLGAGLDYSADVGCLVSQEHLDRVRSHVDDAVAKGAKIVTGGTARPDIGPTFFTPTVLADVPPAATCYATETFGPVVATYPVDSDNDAVELINDTPYGLHASVWSRDRSHAFRTARRIRSGTVAINEAYTSAWGAMSSPMGGRGQSGLGRRHGAEGLLRFTDPQSVVVERGPGLGPLYAQGGERVAALFSGLLRAARRAHVPWP